MVELFKSTANSNFIELIICRVFSDPVTYMVFLSFTFLSSWKEVWLTECLREFYIFYRTFSYLIIEQIHRIWIKPQKTANEHLIEAKTAICLILHNPHEYFVGIWHHADIDWARDTVFRIRVCTYAYTHILYVRFIVKSAEFQW